MTDTTDLIQRMRAAWTYCGVEQALRFEAADALEQQAAQIEALRAEKDDSVASMMGALRLVTDLRWALGDEGKRMPDELIEYARALRADAERYRWLRAKVRGERPLGSSRPAAFAFPSAIGLPPLSDILRGSVAQHLDAAIDAALRQEASNG